MTHYISKKERENCSSKKAFETKNSARYKAGKIKYFFKKKGIDMHLRVYHCPVCRKYHLTTKSVEEQKEYQAFWDSLD